MITNWKKILWLEAFAKNHEFFPSFLLHYRLKQHLSNNQYYWLQLYINLAEEQGDTLLNTSEIEFLEKFSIGNKNLRAIFSIYEDKGYLKYRKYKVLLSLKAEMVGDPKEVKALESLFKQKVVKVPCPHCNYHPCIFLIFQ